MDTKTFQRKLYELKKAGKIRVKSLGDNTIYIRAAKREQSTKYYRKDYDHAGSILVFPRPIGAKIDGNANVRFTANYEHYPKDGRVRRTKKFSFKLKNIEDITTYG